MLRNLLAESKMYGDNDELIRSLGIPRRSWAFWRTAAAYGSCYSVLLEPLREWCAAHGISRVCAFDNRTLLQEEWKRPANCSAPPAVDFSQVIDVHSSFFGFVAQRLGETWARVGLAEPVGLTLFGALMLLANFLALRLSKYRKKKGTPEYPLQQAVTRVDMLSIVLIVATKHEYTLGLGWGPRACYDSAYRYAIQAPASLFIATLMTSLILHTVMCVDRLQGMRNPMGYRGVNGVRRSRWALALALVVTVPLALFLNLPDRSLRPHACSFQQDAVSVGEAVRKDVVCGRLAAVARWFYQNPHHLSLNHAQWVFDKSHVCGFKHHARKTIPMYGVLGLLNLVMVVAAVFLLAAFRRTVAKRRRQRDAWENKAESHDMTVTIVVVGQAVLQILQTVLMASGELCWKEYICNYNTFYIFGPMLDTAIIFAVSVQLMASFLAPLALSAQYRADFLNMLRGCVGLPPKQKNNGIASSTAVNTTSGSK